MAAVDMTVQVQRKGRDLTMTIGGKTTVLSIPDWLKKNCLIDGEVITDEQIAELLAKLDESDKEKDQA